MMSVWTATARGTVALHIRFAWWPVRIQAEAIFTLQEVAEVEAVHGLADFLDLRVRCHGA
jgi:hypothetical protein